VPLSRAQQQADAAHLFADAGVPVWTDGVPESVGVLGVFDTVPGDGTDEGGFTHEGVAETLTILPGALGSLPVRSAVYGRPPDADGAAVTFLVQTGPTPTPPDRLFHVCTVTRLGGG
jgi:hypothetical protein